MNTLGSTSDISSSLFVVSLSAVVRAPPAPPLTTRR
eukprot:gene13597-21233_t